jgi:hypothetical protein
VRLGNARIKRNKMRITKEKAELVAEKLTAKKKEKRDLIIKQLEDFSTEIALKNIPKPVMDMFAEYPKYINTRSYINIQGEGINNYSLNYRNISRELPREKGDGDLSVTKEQATLIQKLHDLEQSMRSEINLLEREITDAVYNLRTYSRCENEFPEAFKHLPKEGITTAVSINIEAIRAKLD